MCECVMMIVGVLLLESHDFPLETIRGESAAAHHGESRPKEPRDDGETMNRALVFRGCTTVETDPQLQQSTDSTY